MSVRLTSKKTLPVLIDALTRISFTQTELAHATKTSIGRVNKVISFLQEKEVIVKEKGKYVVAQPNRLAELIASQQVITKTRTYRVQLEREPKELLRCLDQDQVINALDTKEAQAALNKLPRGSTIINLFSYDQPPSERSDVRTIIDLITIGEGYKAEELAMKLWGTRQ